MRDVIMMNLPVKRLEWKKENDDLRRIDTLYRSSILRLHELIVYEEANGLVVFAAIGRCELDYEVRHRNYVIMLVFSRCLKAELSIKSTDVYSRKRKAVRLPHLYLLILPHPIPTLNLSIADTNSYLSLARQPPSLIEGCSKFQTPKSLNCTTVVLRSRSLTGSIQSPNCHSDHDVPTASPSALSANPIPREARCNCPCALTKIQHYPNSINQAT